MAVIKPVPKVEPVGEVAIAVWDVLSGDARQRLGWTTATELMRRTGLSRPEVNAALRELVAGHWVQRTVVEQDGQLREHWRAGVRRPRRQGGGRVTTRRGMPVESLEPPGIIPVAVISFATFTDSGDFWDAKTID
jgi:hypothetical protein